MGVLTSTPPYPPEVYDLVHRAGERNSFVYDSQGPVLNPGVGEALPRLTNLVPGGDIEATQATTSAQPVQGGDGASSFGGDDWFDVPELAGQTFPTQYTIAGVWDFPSLDTNSFLASLRKDNTNAARLHVRYDNDEAITIELWQGGDVVVASISVSDPLGKIALAATADVTSGEVELAIRGAQDDIASGSGSLTDQNATIGTANIGSFSDGLNPVNAACSAKLLARTTYDAATLADALAAHHGIL